MKNVLVFDPQVAHTESHPWTSKYSDRKVLLPPTFLFKSSTILNVGMNFCLKLLCFQGIRSILFFAKPNEMSLKFLLWLAFWEHVIGF